MTGTVAPNIPTKGDALGTSDKKIRGSLTTLRDAHNELLTSENLVEKAKLEKAAKPVTWYTPKVIATEETRENVAFGTLTTKDEITGVVVPENGLVAVAYSANWKSSVASAGRAAVFVGGNQLKTLGAVQEASTTGTILQKLFSTSGGLGAASSEAAFATTGETLGGASAGGLCLIQRLPAGTYAISVQWKATSGNVTAKERALGVMVFGS